MRGKGINMNEIINFVKEILMLEGNERTPVGLCAFEGVTEKPKCNVAPKRKREMRLSELMDK